MSSTKFVTGDTAYFQDPKYKEGVIFTLAEVVKVVPDCPDGPFYRIKFLEGRERYMITNAFEHHLFSYDEKEAFLEEASVV